MSRLDQINELLHHELASLITRDIPLDNGLITIVYVDTSPDLQHSRIGVSVLPENVAGTALEKLRKHNAPFAAALKKKLRLHHIPKLHWVFDDTEKKAAQIEEVFKQIT